MDTIDHRRTVPTGLERNNGRANLEQSILSIEQGANPDGRCVCDFGNLGMRVVHILIAIAWEQRNGSIEKGEALALASRAKDAMEDTAENDNVRERFRNSWLSLDATAGVITAKSEEDQALAVIFASEAITSVADSLPAKSRVPYIRIFFAGMALGVAMGVGAAYPEQVRGAGATVVDGVEEVGGAVGRTMEWVGDKISDGWDAIKRKLKEVEERNKRDQWFTGGE